jgi:hypothetical protein
MTTLRTKLAALAVAVTVAAAVLGGAAATAGAATYTVLSCRDRAGAPAALGDAAGGWVPGSTGGPGLDALDRCAEPGHGFLATVSGVWPHPVGSMAWWRFAAPPGTVIEGAALEYSGYARPFDGQSEGIVYLRTAAGAIPAIELGSGPLPARWVSVRGLHEAWLQATAQCDGPSGNADCQAGTVHATIEVLRSEVVLADDAPPNAGPAGGSAVAAATWQGTETFAFAASDQGSGVYQAVLEVDGAPVLARTIDDWRGRCVDTTAGERVFTRPQPCPISADALVTVDAATLPAGDHDVALRVSDAAGNLRTVYAARKTIAGPAAPVAAASAAAEPDERSSAPAPAAVLVARWARTRGTTLTARYGVRSVIRGRLTGPGGIGVANARIELLTAIDGRRAVALDKGGARTRADGRFTLVVGRGVCSRTLLLRYRRHAGDAATAQARLRLRVRAGVALALAPGAVPGRRAVAVAGRLVGRPLPHRRTLVELQARRPGRPWATVRLLRAGRDGRFSARYAPPRRGRRELRAVVRATADYPYATGASRPVRVR